MKLIRMKLIRIFEKGAEYNLKIVDFMIKTHFVGHLDHFYGLYSHFSTVFGLYSILLIFFDLLKREISTIHKLIRTWNYYEFVQFVLITCRIHFMY